MEGRLCHSQRALNENALALWNHYLAKIALNSGIKYAKVRYSTFNRIIDVFSDPFCDVLL